MCQVLKDLLFSKWKKQDKALRGLNNQRSESMSDMLGMLASIARILVSIKKVFLVSKIVVKDE